MDKTGHSAEVYNGFLRSSGHQQNAPRLPLPLSKSLLPRRAPRLWVFQIDSANSARSAVRALGQRKPQPRGPWTVNIARVGYPSDAPGRPASTTSVPPVRDAASRTVTRSRILNSARMVDGVAVQEI